MPTTPMPKMSTMEPAERRRPKSSMPCWSGVRPGSKSFISWAARPNSVSIPVQTTMHRARPARTNVPANNTVRQSERQSWPSGASLHLFNASAAKIATLATASDSPVREDSSTSSSLHSTTRQSAGTRSPAETTTTSPGTSSEARSSAATRPPRTTTARGGTRDARAFKDCSLLVSWTNATNVTINTAAAIETASSYWPSSVETTAEPKSKRTRGSLSCAKNLEHAVSGSSCESSFGP
mmetsp:Transcript_26418/g.88841  ORF Transcript_26418/g.88841 Transcript_26418/m.88841 type:complete len:238 (+) Transcript_26418:2325-3038(+)